MHADLQLDESAKLHSHDLLAYGRNQRRDFLRCQVWGPPWAASHLSHPTQITCVLRKGSVGWPIAALDLIFYRLQHFVFLWTVLIHITASQLKAVERMVAVGYGAAFAW
ncbi:hypothetical protein D8674_036291 [Pyrus ussuriensis x Pyrus communis]|uniref:Uncharacterized protein n=1 Tax=Pyrus ussuriensis x Pyrus communis TaxID=2448454 RepID=A0A5N5GER0_9ROSA|nr:hypothetical protein D8674_036291 [Pyrus ussuriensis x Pyrus communis]